MSEQQVTTLEGLGERIGGLAALVTQGFTDIQRQLNLVEGLPVKVEGLARDLEAHKRHADNQITALVDRIEELEEEKQRGQEWRRGSLPMIALTLVLALVALAGLLATVIR